MLVVIYNCPIFVKVGGWSFTLLPGRHTKFGLNQLKTEKVSPQHILLLGAVSGTVHPVKVEELASLPDLPGRPLLKNQNYRILSKFVGQPPMAIILARYKSGA